MNTPEFPWSFEQIYKEYRAPIFSYLCYLVQDFHQAEDLTQDTFVKAFRALPQMDASLKLSAWLYRIATNTAYDALRRGKLIAWSSWEELDREPASFETDDPQVVYGTAELVHSSLKSLPTHYRQALILYIQEGYNYQEIAHMLGSAEGGVKMLLFRARKSFREHYKHSTNNELVRGEEIP